MAEPPEDSQPAEDQPREPGPAITIEEVGEVSPEDERVAELIEHTIDVPVLASAVGLQEAADAADILESLPEKDAAEVLEQMDDQAAADAVAEMQMPLAVMLAADLLQAMGESFREEILAAAPLGTATQLRQLIGYDRESAGGLMTTDYLALEQSMTVAQAVDVIRGRELPEGVQHLMVVGPDGRLAGIIGLRDLLLNDPDDQIADLMNRTVKAVRPAVDREEVSREFNRYDYSMMPVVDLDDRLIGIVTVDDVIDIIVAEQTEDVQKTVGAGAVEAVYSRLGEKFKGRVPWLGMSLVMTCLAAVIVLVFEDLIAERPILAFLLPVIAALVGNAGHQALAVTLRGIVLDEVRRDLVWPLLTREAALGLLNGAALGTVILLVVTTMGLVVEHASWQLGLVAGVSTMIAMGVGTLAGSGIPLVMHRLGIDPAQASAIFLIMITDAVAFTTLLTLSFVLLAQMA